MTRRYSQEQLQHQHDEHENNEDGVPTVHETVGEAWEGVGEFAAFMMEGPVGLVGHALMGTLTSGTDYAGPHPEDGHVTPQELHQMQAEQAHWEHEHQVEQQAEDHMDAGTHGGDASADPYGDETDTGLTYTPDYNYSNADGTEEHVE